MEIDEETILKTMTTTLKGLFKPNKANATPTFTDVIKSESNGEEQRLFTAVVLRPNEVDGHKEIYSEDTVMKACHEYNEFCASGNLQHMIQTDKVVPVESWIAKADQELGEGIILKGDWVMTVRVDNDEIWDMCKKGVFTGFSVGCRALSSKLSITEEEDVVKAWAATLKAKEPTIGH